MSNLFRRRNRSLDELLRDPNFPYHVGRLMGAAEMTSHWLTTREDKDAQQMGYRLSGIVSWFFEEDAWKAEAVTEVRNPALPKPK
jgi:hypothetical protein